MSSTSVFKSFDPLAVHPFTNNSGLLPQPTPPSQYPQPLPSSAPSSLTSTPSSSPTPGLVHAPQPKVASPTQAKKALGSPVRAPVFVPFRPERSSPELDEILLKKKIADALSNKQTWSIDQASVPAVYSSQGARR